MNSKTSNTKSEMVIVIDTILYKVGTEALPILRTMNKNHHVKFHYLNIQNRAMYVY